MTTDEEKIDWINRALDLTGPLCMLPADTKPESGRTGPLWLARCVRLISAGSDEEAASVMAEIQTCEGVQQTIGFASIRAMTRQQKELEMKERMRSIIHQSKLSKIEECLLTVCVHGVKPMIMWTDDTIERFIFNATYHSVSQAAALNRTTLSMLGIILT